MLNNFLEKSIVLMLIVGLCVADPETVYGTNGSAIIFICPYKDSKVRWISIYIEGTFFTISQGASIAQTQPFGNRVSIVGDNTAGEYNLQLSGLQESDQGVFQCSVGVQLKQYKLELLAAPSLLTLQDVTTDNQILGTEGQSLTLRCTAAGGKPPPLVTIFVGNVCNSSNQAVECTITNLQRRYDRQMVRCDANSSALSSPLVTTATLYLYLKPFQPIMRPDQVSTEETESLVVSCTSTGSRPAATFQWTIGVANITSYSATQYTLNTSDDTYTVTSTLNKWVDRTYNKQTIICTAVNVVSTSGTQTSRILDVKFAPDITVNNVTYDQNTATRTITCKPFGNPATYTYYKWQHKSTYGELIRELVGGQNGVLTLPSVPAESRYQDSGEYVCTAGNGITGRDGKINQTGSGYVFAYAQPTFTNSNKDTEYGEFGSDVTVHVYVYSVPKYTSVRWYKSNMQIAQNDKYTFSESTAIVKDTFHGIMVQLDGYRVTLIINNLVESDFYVRFRVELSNDIGQPVVYTKILLSVGAPQTPLNFTILTSTESSIIVQWEAGYNGGHEQTFYLQFRRFGSSAWVAVKIPDTKQSGMQTYTLSELQDGILFELMMYAENMVKKSSPTETKTIATIKDSRLSSSEAIIKGVAGSMSAVIFIMCMIIALVILWKKENNKQKSKAQYSRWKEETAYSIPMDVKETDENTDAVNKRGKHIKTITGSEKEYETLGMKDNPNTYSEIITQQGQQQSEKSAQEYETLGTVDNPNIYSALNSQSAQPSSEYTNIEI